MVKVIHLEKEYNCDHLLGKFLEDDAYDVVLNEDTDVYKPNRFGPDESENNLLLKFRKGVFSPEQTRECFAGLYSGATLTDNRGLAAGAERKSEYQHLPNGDLGQRRWVTKREKAVIEYFADLSPMDIFGDDQADSIYTQQPNNPLDGRGGGVVGPVCIKGGSIWIVKRAHEVNFDEWFHKTKQLDPEQRRQAAIDLCQNYISDTTYGEGVYSGVGGFMDRYPRIPFCRQTAWTASHLDKFQMALPLMEEASRVYSREIPIRWKGQRDAANSLDKDFRIGDTVYTTVTINKSFRTACHRDAGDLCEDGNLHVVPRGFSNLTVVTNGKKFDGFYLCFPEYRVAANIQDGDFIMMDAHKIHGNTPLKNCDEGFERISVVLYFRESMLECGSKAYEEARRKYVYERKANYKQHGQKSNWNGISPGMFSDPEWFDYLRHNGLEEYIDA